MGHASDALPDSLLAVVFRWKNISMQPVQTFEKSLT
jgi:hypothetical protein